MAYVISADKFLKIRKKKTKKISKSKQDKIIASVKEKEVQEINRFIENNTKEYDFSKASFDFDVDPYDINQVIAFKIFMTSLLNSCCSNIIVHRLFNHLQRIGSESVYGVVTKDKESKFPIVIKSTNSMDDDLIHEIFINIKLNELREENINFPYLFSFFICSFPIVHKKKVIMFCNNKIMTINSVIEAITPSVSLREFIKTASTSEFLEVFYQIFLTLSLFNIKFKYTHYDLHDNNIIIKKFNAPISLKYFLEDETFYISTKYLAVIIDFGMNYIHTSGGHFGLLIPPIAYLKSSPATDILRLLVILGDVTVKHSRIYTIINKIFVASFGVTLDDFDKISKKNSLKDNDLLPYDPSLKDITYRGFLKHLIYNDTIPDITTDAAEYRSPQNFEKDQNIINYIIGKWLSGESDKITFFRLYLAPSDERFIPRKDFDKLKASSIRKLNSILLKIDKMLDTDEKDKWKQFYSLVSILSSIMFAKEEKDMMEEVLESKITLDYSISKLKSDVKYKFSKIYKAIKKSSDDYTENIVDVVRSILA